MVGTVPGIIPKTALVASRVVYYPFTIPQKMTDSATLTGSALNGMVAGVSSAIGSAYDSLQPRGPAKWLSNLFGGKVAAATARSEEIAQRNKTVFWDPFSQGVEQVGRALASPGTYYYLKKSGVENPSQDAIKAVLQLPLFSFPGGEEVAAGQANFDAAKAAAEAAAAEASNPVETPAAETEPPAEPEPVATPPAADAAGAAAAEGAGQIAA